MQIDLFSAPKPVGPPDLGLRYYQQGAREGIHAVHSRSRGALVVLPTGTGKSRLAGAVSWDWHLEGGHVLILTPTITLTRQMYKDIRTLGLSCGMEQASNRVERPLPAVTVACVDSMKGKRLASFAPNDFSHIVFDEAHRAVSPKYKAIADHFAGAKLVGLTATPERTDGVALANTFDEEAYRMTMLQAIKEGWLVPLHFKTAVTDFDPRMLRTIAGEVDAGSVAAEITRSGLLHEAANTLADLSEGERVVAFLPTVASSQAFCAELEARGVPAAHVDASTPEQHRDEYVAAFISGKIRVLSNVGIFIEGWDCPSASVVALLNPTKSWCRLAQMIGRITRPCSGKESALVIDFCPGRLKKGRLAGPADALAGKMLDDKVHEHLKEGDIAEAIEKAEKTAAEIEERERKKRERAEKRKARRERLKELARQKQYHYTVNDHDADDLLGGSGSGLTTAKLRYSDDSSQRQDDAVTNKQSELLKKLGMSAELIENLDRRSASRHIGRLLERRNAGLASLWQIDKLSKYVPVPNNTSFHAAMEACEYLKRTRNPDPSHLSALLKGDVPQAVDISNLF